MNTQQYLHPQLITGFSWIFFWMFDSKKKSAESSITILINRDLRFNAGWQIRLGFSIGLHVKDKSLLETIQKSLGGIGSISKQRSDSVLYKILPIKQLKVLINHFDNNKLNTQNWLDSQFFKQAFYLISRKEHLIQKKLKKLVAIKGSINNKLSDELKTAFPYVIPAPRPLSTHQGGNINPNWLAGFVSGEGNLFIHITGSKTHTIGNSVALNFAVTQQFRDIQLIDSLTKLFECGRIELFSNNLACFFVVTKFSDIYDIIIPNYFFFPGYFLCLFFFFSDVFLNERENKKKKNTSKLRGKQECFFFLFHHISNDEKEKHTKKEQVAELIKRKEHLTKAGLEKIKTIKNVMNTNRIITSQYLISSKIEFKKPLGKRFLFTTSNMHNSVLNSQRALALYTLNKLDICSVKCPNSIREIKHLTWLSNESLMIFNFFFFKGKLKFTLSITAIANTLIFDLITETYEGHFLLKRLEKTLFSNIFNYKGWRKKSGMAKASFVFISCQNRLSNANKLAHILFNP